MRLAEVKFADDGEPDAIKVIGSLRFAPAQADATGEGNVGPFGQDEIYLRNELFALKLTRLGTKWTYQWTGKSIRTDSDKLTFLDRSEPVVSLEVELSGNPHDAGDLHMTQTVPARIDLNIDSHDCAVSARLFGSDHTLAGQAVPSPDGFTMTLAGTGNNGDIGLRSAITAALFWPSGLTVTIMGNTGKLAVRSALEIHPLPNKGGPTPDPLTRVDGMTSTWLGIDGPTAPITADYATSIFTWNSLNKNKVNPELPFDLQARAIDFSAALAFAASTSQDAISSLGPVPMSAAWAQAAIIDSNDDGSTLDYRLLASVDGGRQHAPHLTWPKHVDSPILWPIGQVRQADGQPLAAD
ncbi:MAG: hypothetical protein MO852_06195 [Candidatus Devosia euplotis]|nr:hypothetical protein [Candidatus Devosia euplotis]